MKIFCIDPPKAIKNITSGVCQAVFVPLLGDFGMSCRFCTLEFAKAPLRRVLPLQSVVECGEI